jgi:hypothetical protein
MTQSVRCPVCGLFVRGLYGPGNTAPAKPHHPVVDDLFALAETRFTTTPLCSGSGEIGPVAESPDDDE